MPEIFPGIIPALFDIQSVEQNMRRDLRTLTVKTLAMVMCGTVWVNRFTQPLEQLGVRPDRTVVDLKGLLDFVLN